MASISEEVTTLLHTTILELYPDSYLNLKKYAVHRGNRTGYQFNQVHALAKTLDLEPINVAKNLYNNFLLKKSIIDQVEIVNIGKQIFIVFNIEKKYLENMINNLYSNSLGQKTLPWPSINDPLRKKNVIIDFSSPNIAKEMHVGHLRSTIIGESLCRIHEYCGYNVKRINHVGDWGTQFGMLIAYIKKYNIKEYMLSDLMRMYKESRILFDSDSDFNKNAHIETVNLQRGLPENITIWKNICDISMESFNKIYSQLDTHAIVRGESFYQTYMVDLVKDLDATLTNKDGMKVYFPTGFDVPLIFVKSDGGFTYDTSDMAAIKYRLHIEKADQIIYVVDSGQQLHFQLVFQTAVDLGLIDNISKLKHAGFGIVLGPDGKKLKTRSGETIKLRDLLEQAFDHARVITTALSKERHPDWDESMINTVAKKISINCIKYADLSNPRQNNYKFSFEKMLNLKGNTGVYLMYALARCKAILRKVPDLDKILEGPLFLDTDDARNLAFKLVKYSEAINDSIKELAPHHICNYLYDLVGLLTKFYESNRCIEFGSNNEIIKVHGHRVRLVYMVKVVIQKLFNLVGLEDIEQI